MSNFLIKSILHTYSSRHFLWYLFSPFSSCAPYLKVIIPWSNSFQQCSIDPTFSQNFAPIIIHLKGEAITISSWRPATPPKNTEKGDKFTAPQTAFLWTKHRLAPIHSTIRRWWQSSGCAFFRHMHTRWTQKLAHCNSYGPCPKPLASVRADGISDKRRRRKKQKDLQTRCHGLWNIE